MPEDKTYLLRSKLIGYTDSYDLYELFTGKLISEAQGCDYHNFEFQMFERKLICQVNATLHIEKYMNTPSVIRGFQILFCIYDVNDKESINFLKKYILEIEQKCAFAKVVVIGLTDGSENTLVTEQDISSMTLNYKFHHLKLNASENKKELLKKYCIGYLLQNDEEFKKYYDSQIELLNNNKNEETRIESHKRKKTKSCVVV